MMLSVALVAPTQLLPQSFRLCYAPSIVLSHLACESLVILLAVYEAVQEYIDYRR